MNLNLKHTSVVMILLLGLLATNSVAQLPTTGKLLTQVDFESNDFTGAGLSGDLQQVVANPMGPGKVFRAHVPNHNQRSEIVINDHRLGDGKWEGSTQWYAWSLFLPTDFQPSGKHTILAQWHRWQPGMGRGPLSWANGHPNVLSIDKQTGHYTIGFSFQPDLNDPKHRREYVSTRVAGPTYHLDRGRWVRWVARIHWSKSDRGSVVLYRNGYEAARYDGANYLDLPLGPNFKCGLYTGHPWSGDPKSVTVFTDDVLIGDANCSLSDMSPQPPTVKHQTTVVRDVPYAGTQNPKQQLDLVVPTEPTAEGPLPVVVFIHGGGWKKGDRRGYFGRAQNLAATGRYAAATIGYRLSDESVWPAQLHDVKAAVRWLKANASQYNLDTNRFAAAGGSAGGHLAAMLGVTGNDPDLNGDLGDHASVSSEVHLVLDRYGPTDFLSMNDAPGKMDHNAATSPESLLIGGPIQKHPERARSASPTSFVDSHSARFLIQHGQEDTSVPVDQSRQLAKLLEDAGVEVQLIEIPNSGHGLKRIPGLIEREIDFLDQHFWSSKDRE